MTQLHTAAVAIGLLSPFWVPAAFAGFVLWREDATRWTIAAFAVAELASFGFFRWAFGFAALAT